MDEFDNVPVWNLEFDGCDFMPADPGWRAADPAPRFAGRPRPKDALLCRDAAAGPALRPADLRSGSGSGSGPGTPCNAFPRSGVVFKPTDRDEAGRFRDFSGKGIRSANKDALRKRESARAFRARKKAYIKDLESRLAMYKRMVSTLCAQLNEAESHIDNIMCTY